MHTVVWEPLSAEERYLLMAMAQVEHVTPKQICMLLDCAQMPPYVYPLLNRGGFISYDVKQNHYIMHQILRDYAQRHTEDLPVSEQVKLRERAAAVYIDAGMLFLALECLFYTGQYEAVMKLPLRNVDMADYENQRVVSLLEKIIDVCPQDLLQEYPGKVLRFAFEFLMRGETALYQHTCAIMNDFFRTNTFESTRDKQEFYGEYIFLRSFDAINDLAKMNAAHKMALRVMGGPSKAFDANRYWTFGVPSILSMYWGTSGPLNVQLTMFEEGMKDYLLLTGGHGAGAATLMRAEACLGKGDREQTEILCHKAVFLAEEHHQDTVYFGAQLTLGRLAILQGDAQRYQAVMEHIRTRAHQGTEKSRHLMAMQCTAWLDLELARQTEELQWLAEEKNGQSRLSVYGICYMMILQCKQYLLKNEYNQLLGIAELMIEKATQQRSVLSVVYFNIFLACAKHGTGHFSAAMTNLKQALDIALPDEIYLPFVEHAGPLQALLERMQTVPGMRQSISTILRLGKQQQHGAIKIRHTVYGTDTTLTKRETEVAAFAQKGYTNKEIAELLSISPETVKKLLQKVYQKLEIHGKQQLFEKNSEFCRFLYPIG